MMNMPRNSVTDNENGVKQRDCRSLIFTFLETFFPKKFVKSTQKDSNTKINTNQHIFLFRQDFTVKGVIVYI
jgi:hypothetical protein